MSILNEKKYEEKLKETSVLMTKFCRDQKRLERNVTALLNSSQGKTLKEKKKYLRERFIDDVSYQTLCRLINKAELEINLSLEAGGLLEYQARRILSEKDPLNQIWIYERALELELAGDKKFNSSYIDKAIEELKARKNTGDGKAASSTKVKPDKNKNSVIKGAKKSVTKIANDSKSMSDIEDVSPEYDFDDDEPPKEVTAKDIYNEIRPNIKSSAERLLLISVINASDKLRKVLNIVMKVKLSDKKSKQLVNLIGKNSAYRNRVETQKQDVTSQRPKKSVGKAKIVGNGVKKKRPSHSVPKQ